MNILKRLTPPTKVVPIIAPKVEAKKSHPYPSTFDTATMFLVKFSFDSSCFSRLMGINKFDETILEAEVLAAKATFDKVFSGRTVDKIEIVAVTDGRTDYALYKGVL